MVLCPCQVAPLSMFWGGQHEDKPSCSNRHAQVSPMPQHSFLMVSHHVWGNCIETRQQSSGMATTYDVLYIAKGGGSANKTQLLGSRDQSARGFAKHWGVLLLSFCYKPLAKTSLRALGFFRKTKGVLNDKAPQCMCKSLQFRIVFLACRGWWLLFMKCISH